ncbi:hypothetical protein RFI_23938, partial [Reticulomyxa filosa]
NNNNYNNSHLEIMENRGVIKDFVKMFIDASNSMAMKQQIQDAHNNGAGEDTHSQIYKNVPIKYKNQMGGYKEFEKGYLDETQQYYLQLSSQWLESFDCAAYLKQVSTTTIIINNNKKVLTIAEEREREGYAERVMIEEQEREFAYLHHSTHEKLLKTLYAVLLVGPQTKLLKQERSGVYAMVANQSKEDLHRLYHLYSLVPSRLPFIAKLVCKRMQHEGDELIRQCVEEKTSDQLVSRLTALYTLHDSMITTCFKNHPHFNKALKDGYTHIVNRPLNGGLSIQELLAAHTDYLLRKDSGNKLTSENELFQQLDQIVKVFAYVNDKDVFLEFYKQLLAKRLLTKKSVNDHAEKHFVTKLKVVSSQLSQNTQNSKYIHIYMERSVEHGGKFERYMKDHRRELPYEFEPHVLTCGFWPNFPSLGITLPRSMQYGIKVFEEYFSSLFEKRKLSWLHDLSSLEINSYFPESDKMVTLQVSVLQGCILLIFNQIESIRIIDVTKMLNCDPNLVKSQLKPLCSRQFPILLKQPSKGYKPEDTYINITYTLKKKKKSICVNKAFNPSRRMIRIPTGVKRITNEDRQENNSAVINERKLLIDACLVRIMKARKRLEHPQLIGEVIQQLTYRFYPQPEQIHERIAELINREYFSRDPNNASIYIYT